MPDTISKIDGLAIGANYTQQIMTSLQLEQDLLLLLTACPLIQTNVA
jgi:hypothetical protein